MIDPIKAEICGLSDHTGPSPHHEKAPSLVAPSKGPTDKLQIESVEGGVCPIRFLDQHSPEEVATYFEKHKHELPRSHEVCVMRYQSNEEQIKELDAKYGNLVSMIQGLGQRHKEMLPEDIVVEDEEDDVDGSEKALSDEKIRKWAKSVSAQAPDAEVEVEEQTEERLPHFERPVRDIRVGESPSRPWGIHVPAKYADVAGDVESGDEIGSKPARVISSPAALQQQPAAIDATGTNPMPKMSGGAGKCPFDHKAMKAGAGMGAAFAAAAAAAKDGAAHSKPTIAEPAVPPEASRAPPDQKTAPSPAEALSHLQQPTIVINGPVFFGYSPEDTIRILKESGLKVSQ